MGSISDIIVYQLYLHRCVYACIIAVMFQMQSVSNLWASHVAPSLGPTRKSIETLPMSIHPTKWGTRFPNTQYSFQCVHLSNILFNIDRDVNISYNDMRTRVLNCLEPLVVAPYVLEINFVRHGWDTRSTTDGLYHLER